MKLKELLKVQDKPVTLGLRAENMVMLGLRAENMVMLGLRA
jgi:hypothetical protein